MKNLNKKEWQQAEAEKAGKQKDREKNISLYMKAMGIRPEKPKKQTKEETCEQ